MDSPVVAVKLPMTNEPSQKPLHRTAADWGTFVEDLGYDSIWVSEGWGSDVFVTLTEIACATEEIGVGSAIANVFSRSPAVLAMASSSIDRISDGRAYLGVGASHAETIEGLHGMTYDRPVRRVHETIEAITAMTNGSGSVEYDGEVISAKCDAPVESTVDVYNAALGEANRRATGRVADGWLPHLIPFSSYDDAFETVERAARQVGRDPSEIRVVPQVLSAVGENPQECRDYIKRFVVDYIGRKGAYREAIAAVYPDETAAIVDAWNAGNEQMAIKRVTEEMVDDFGVAGHPDHARERLRNLLQRDVVDCPMVFVPKQADVETVERTLTELRPPVL